jgi:hypothetical protein
MRSQLIDDFERAITALETAHAAPEAAYDELEAEICRRSRVLAYDFVAAILFCPGLVAEPTGQRVCSLFDRALSVLGKSQYAENVAARREEILEAQRSALRRKQEDTEFQKRVAQELPSANPQVTDPSS